MSSDVTVGNPPPSIEAQNKLSNVPAFDVVTVGNPPTLY